MILLEIGANYILRLIIYKLTRAFNGHSVVNKREHKQKMIEQKRTAVVSYFLPNKTAHCTYGIVLPRNHFARDTLPKAFCPLLEALHTLYLDETAEECIMPMHRNDNEPSLAK